jgi:hypothetical protein
VPANQLLSPRVCVPARVTADQGALPVRILPSPVAGQAAHVTQAAGAGGGHPSHLVARNKNALVVGHLMAVTHDDRAGGGCRFPRVTRTPVAPAVGLKRRVTRAAGAGGGTAGPIDQKIPATQIGDVDRAGEAAR